MVIFFNWFSICIQSQNTQIFCAFIYDIKILKYSTHFESLKLIHIKGCECKIILTYSYLIIMFFFQVMFFRVLFLSHIFTTYLSQQNCPQNIFAIPYRSKSQTPFKNTSFLSEHIFYALKHHPLHSMHKTANTCIQKQLLMN